MITLDDLSPVPAYEQISSQISGLIRAGRLPGGHKLPSVRQLARDLQIAPGTVVRAYAELERRGFVETNRGRTAEVRPNQGMSSEVVEAARLFAATAQSHTVDLTSALNAIRALWDPAQEW